MFIGGRCHSHGASELSARIRGNLKRLEGFTECNEHTDTWRALKYLATISNSCLRGINLALTLKYEVYNKKKK